jgi:hypothetical protein
MEVWNDSLIPEIAVDSSWHNGTGYLNGAVYANVATTSKFVLKDGRRGLIIPTTRQALDKQTATAKKAVSLVKPECNIVIFERYTPGHGPEVLVANTCKELKTLVPSACEMYELELILKIMRKERLSVSDVKMLIDKRDYALADNEDDRWLYNHMIETLTAGLKQYGLM